MELKSIYGDVIFARKGARTILELVTAAVAAKKSLGGANLRGADLGGADLGGAYLGGADLSGANLGGKKIAALSAFSGSLYPYEVWAVLYGDGTRSVRMGCHFNTLEEWASIDLRSNNIGEFPDDGSEISEERAALFELAKAAAMRMNLPVAVPQQESEER